MKSSRVSVAATPTLLVDQGDGGDPFVVFLANPTGGVAVDLGGSDVTAGAGFQLLAGVTLKVELANGDTLYGVVATGTQAIQVLHSAPGV